MPRIKGKSLIGLVREELANGTAHDKILAKVKKAAEKPDAWTLKRIENESKAPKKEKTSKEKKVKEEAPKEKKKEKKAE